MERILVVVFDDEAKSYEGTHALKQLDSEGSISIHAEAVIEKNADGTIAVKQSEGDFPVRTIGGTVIGSLIGLLAGPVGAGVGAAAGWLAGAIGDLAVAGIDAEFLDDVAVTMTPGKCAVIADVSEEWVTPVDTKMEALGGKVFRKARKSVAEDQWARDVEEMRTEIEQLKAEQAQARGERKAKLQAKIDKLNAELQAKLDQAKQRSEQIKNETDAKVKALEKKAEKAQGEIKATFEARVKHIRDEHQRSEAKLKHLLAGQLRAAAARLEK
jgi:uncharacterized membrane protein